MKKYEDLPYHRTFEEPYLTTRPKRYPWLTQDLFSKLITALCMTWMRLSVSLWQRYSSKWQHNVHFWWFCSARPTQDIAVERLYYETVETVLQQCSQLSVFTTDKQVDRQIDRHRQTDRQTDIKTSLWNVCTTRQLKQFFNSVASSLCSQQTDSVGLTSHLTHYRSF